ncbi:MAG: dethiobiotin synthase [Candidatus Rariloculaceae bacterium]
MSRIFISSSGTEIGKTFVACTLIKQLQAAGFSVDALKPVASGFDLLNIPDSDTGALLSALGRNTTVEEAERISPWRFQPALSPDLAAAREQRSVPFDALVDYCTESRPCDLTLIEGIGGVMVPLDEAHTVLDWIEAVAAPLLLVVGGYLGTLSHTLTAIEALHGRGQSVAGIVVNESDDQPVSLDETTMVLERFADSIPVVALPRVDDYHAAPDLLPLIARYIQPPC